MSSSVQRASGQRRCRNSACAKVERRRGKRRWLKAQRAVVLEDARGDDADAGLVVEDRHERVEVLRLDPGVRVEQQHVGRLAGGDAEVAAGGEAAVARPRRRLERQGPASVAAVVRRGVVDHGDAARSAARRAAPRTPRSVRPLL